MRTIVFISIMVIVALSSIVIASHFVKSVIDSHTFTCPGWAKKCEIKIEGKHELKPGQSSDVVLIAKYEPTTTTTVPVIVYDDFSGSTLDLSKWQILDVDINNRIAEYYVDTTEGVFHVAQPTPHGDTARSVNVKLIGHNFVSGEILDFDMYYKITGGNTANYVGAYGDTAVGITEIGYWNSVLVDGNDIGNYHYRITFYSNSIHVEITKPNSSVVTKDITISNPYTIGFAVNTGHNGVVHIDYDNFVITP